jgi:excisionase family DNA binding protein
MMKNTMPPVNVCHRGEVMSTEQVAAYLGVSFGTIRRWIRDGTLPAAKIGRRLFVRECDVQKILEGTTQTTV